MTRGQQLGAQQSLLTHLALTQQQVEDILGEQKAWVKHKLVAAAGFGKVAARGQSLCQQGGALCDTLTQSSAALILVELPQQAQQRLRLHGDEKSL